MKSHTFSGQDPIAVLGFLARLKMVCDYNGVSKDASVWCFHFYLMRQAHALLPSRLNGDCMAFGVERRGMLKTYPDVVNVWLHTYATDDKLPEQLEM